MPDDSVSDECYLTENLIKSAGGHPFLKIIQQHIIDGPAGVYGSGILLQQVHPLLQDWCKLTEVCLVSGFHPFLQDIQMAVTMGRGQSQVSCLHAIYQMYTVCLWFPQIEVWTDRKVQHLRVREFRCNSPHMDALYNSSAHVPTLPNNS